LNEDVPAGVTWTVLASSVADQLPDAPARLLLTRVLLDRDAGSETVRATGAVLYYVENGSVVIYVDGDQSVLSAKSAVFVPMRSTYAIVNTGDEQASLLRLAVTPPGTNDQPVATVVTPEPLLRTPPASRPTAQVLVRGRVTPLPAPPARLFIACLNFPSGDAAPLIHRHPGPIGLLVERGSLEVDSLRPLPESGCALLQSTSAHALRPPQDGASVLVFGIAADGQSFWSAADASDVPASAPPLAAEDLTCGSP
jgi:mannose-6-phosphate isomerase-like protein (cupin superfamily)